ncbi:uncharacterized protein F5147DRAFT_687259 [Suillus discolor]|uniref:Uncharacterized protein n=1 Tax=Suillus discolor TaxID=1912936 RepID=A0A9P7JVV5_9AGAM|nr:uncharacterized protein F5147DRAFT_687259 [Suillus discolor]KAG2111327.1 hypothetical protein F5147DRAFT_687259 [Suillus discolor]
MVSLTRSNRCNYNIASHTFVHNTVFNSGLQFGSAIGLAGVSSIETSVEAIHGGSHEYKG